jgi:hypothetical protein
MKLIILSIGFSCCAILASAQSNFNTSGLRPTTFQQADLIAGYTPIVPFENAARFTDEICEMLDISEEGLFDRLLDVNYKSEIAITKIGTNEIQSSEKEIRKMQIASIKQLLSAAQFEEFKKHFGHRLE